MKFTNIFQGQEIRGALGMAALLVLAACSKAEPAPAAAAAPPPVAGQVAAAAAPLQVEVPVVVQADYMYYPGYEVYYSPITHVYWYMQGGGWVSGPSVPGISVAVLFAAPSVRMDFHDSPANHHAAVVQQFPRNWQPATPGRAELPQVRSLPPEDRGQPGPGAGQSDQDRGRRG